MSKNHSQKISEQIKSNGNGDQKRKVSSTKERPSLLLGSRDLLKEIINPRKNSTFLTSEEFEESPDYKEVLFHSRKNTLSELPEDTLPVPVTVDSVKHDDKRPYRVKNAIIRFIRARIQFFALLISVSLGCLIGGLMRLRKEKYNELEIYLIQSPGLFYMRSLTGMLMPLIAVSTVSSIVRLNVKLGFELFWRFSLHAVIFKLILISLAMILTLILEPGNGVKVTGSTPTEIVTSDFKVIITDILRNAVPDQFIPVFYEMTRTKVVYTGPEMPDDVKLQQKLFNDPNNWDYILRTVNFPNYIGLITCSVGIGFGLQRLKTINKLILRLTISVENILVQICDWFLSFAAVGKFSLLIAAIVSYDPGDGLQDLFPYVATVFTTGFIYVFIIAPLYFYLITFVNPWPYYKNMYSVLFTAFTTASSVITLPSTITYLEDAKVGHVPCRLMCPFGAVVNMDGTAIHLAVTAVFIAQVLDRDLTFWDFISIWVNSFLQSINISPVPNDASLSAVVRGLLTVGISVKEYQGLITKLENADRFLDRIRSIINVYGDIVTALIVHFVMANAAEKKSGFVNINEYLEKQERKKRDTILERARSERLKSVTGVGVTDTERGVAEGSFRKNEDLELVSISSTTTEEISMYRIT